MTTARKDTLRKRFFKAVYPEPNTGCWLWGSTLDKSGYGTIRIGGKGTRVRKATHVSLHFVGIEMPVGMQACHTCDVRSCVNPDHLFIGTAADNVADMMAKGRGRGPAVAYGYKLPPRSRSVLTPEKVEEIKRLYQRGVTTYQQIAMKLGISLDAVFRAVQFSGASNPRRRREPRTRDRATVGK